jgi:predicted  nucleic acid-binding Zn-ribbon protein
MDGFWMAIVLIFLITRIFKLLEHRNVVSQRQEPQPLSKEQYARIAEEIAEIKREIAEMRDAYTESIVSLQADVRQLRHRIDSASETQQEAGAASTASQQSALNRNLGERTG